MLSKGDNRKKIVEVSRSGKFLSDLETINEALHKGKTLSRLTSSTASSRSKSVGKSHSHVPKMNPKDIKDTSKDPPEKEKKFSWSWKGLKALTQVRNRRFNCCFSLIVHSIEGLPTLFEDTCFVVHWKKRDGELTTRPVRVSKGVAVFEEQMKHSCSVYGSRSGPHHSAKYEPNHCLLFASIYDSPDVDLGKHRIDLTRLLPLTLEDLEDEKNSGKWTTSFRLSGKAREATVNVSFAYAVIGNNHAESSSNGYSPENQSQQRSSTIIKFHSQFNQMDDVRIHASGSLPSVPSPTKQSLEDVKDLHEVSPLSGSDLSESVQLLYTKLDEEIVKTSVSSKLSSDDSSMDHLFKLPESDEKNASIECEISEFSVIEKGIEEIVKEDVEPEDNLLKFTKDSGENIDDGGSTELLIVEDEPIHLTAEAIVSVEEELSLSNRNDFEKENFISTKESLMKELESALVCASELTNEGLDSPETENDLLHRFDNRNSHSNYRGLRMVKSHSLDDVSEMVASDFMDMLGLEHSPFALSSESDPESPRERLLRQFEKDALANGGLLKFDNDNESADLFSDNGFESVWGTISQEFLHSPISDGFNEMALTDPDTFGIQSKASRLEDLESEALMREWGFNEKAFQHSPRSPSGGFGSPINVLPEVSQQLPPLAEGLGPFVQTKNGGFLRSMNPALFRNAKTGGSLILQVSSPVVVPSEMGSGVMEILQGLAAIGIEKLSMQASKLMPLEDITGKTMEQITWEASPSVYELERKGLSQHEFETTQKRHSEHRSAEGMPSCPRSSTFDSSSKSRHTEYVSLEDLAPLAMDKIEALSIEGLRIQSDLSDEDAPSSISSQAVSEYTSMTGNTIDLGKSLGLDGAGGLKLLDIKDSGEDIDGLMGLSLTLDEWMRLDSGEINDDDLVNERTSKILAAHHATSLEIFRGRSKGEKRRGKGAKCGLLGNNFTIGLMVQLRDPVRNYEPVGTPMLALIQVERLFVPPKPKIYSTVLFRSNSKDDDTVEETKASKEDIDKNLTEDIVSEELVPQYKITDVHITGLKTDPGKKKLWGSTNQQQSGSRWLLANGMVKKNKHPALKSKMISSSPMSSAVQQGDTMWSISSRVQGTGAKWKEHAARNRYTRNPNVIL